MVKDMTKGNPYSLIISFAIPVLIGNLMQQAYNLIDAAIVGRYLGASELAAIGATSSVQFMILGFCLGSCQGFSTPIAREFGGKDYSSMRRYLYNAIVLSIGLAVIVTLLCVIFCNGILHLISTPEDIYVNTYQYIFVIFLGIPFTVFYNLSSYAIRAVGDSKTPFYILLVSTFLNIILDFVFVIFLNAGVKGAAIATTISQAVSAFLCTYFLFTRYPVLSIKPEERQIESSRLAELSWLGFPMGLQFSVVAIGSMVMQATINSMGEIYVTGFTAYARLKQFAICPLDSLASAVSIFASQNLGARDFPRIKKGLRTGVTIGISYAVCAGLIYLFLGRYISMIFVSASNVEVLDASAAMLSRLGIFFWLLGILNILRLSVQGLGFSPQSVFSGFVEMVARTSMCLFVVPIFHFQAICLTDQAAWLSATIYIIPMCLWCLKKIEKQIENK